MRRIGLILSVCMLFACSRTTPHADRFCSVGTEELNTAFDTWGKLALESGLPRPVHEGRGNLLAPRALLDERCEMGSVSMPIGDADVDALRRKFGQIPVAVPVAVDALAVFAHSSADARPVSLSDLEILFHSAPAVWPEGFPAKGSLHSFGLNSASDMYRFFKDKGLSGKRVSDRVTEVNGPLSLIDKVAQTPGAVGYARPVHGDNRVKILPLRGPLGPVLPDKKSIQSGAYPLSRYLYIYVRSDRLGKSTRAFLEIVLSDRGQAGLPHFGLVPVGEKEKSAALTALRAIPENP